MTEAVQANPQTSPAVEVTPDRPGVPADHAAQDAPDQSTGVDLRRDYFHTLRSEILQVKARLSRIIVVGVVGAPVLTYFAMADPSNIKLLLIVSPLLAMLLLVLYFSEQSSMMRAGSYIHDKLESSDRDWERWINEQRSKRAEPPLFGLMVIVTVAFSLLMAALALESINDTVMRGDINGFLYYLLRFAVPVIYGLTFLWVIGTILQFWRTAFRAAD
ncbi:MAG: hypothetical protein AAFX76_04280 [Planctomycetota bacterium]